MTLLLLTTRRNLLMRLEPKMTTCSQTLMNISCSSQAMVESGLSRYSRFPTSHASLTSVSPKIPKFLMERWSKFDAEGVQLGKIRIYDVPPGAPPRIIVLVPSEDGGDDDIYELDMVNQDVHNQVVVAERAKAPSGTGRARTTIMTGKVKHECNLRPRMTGRYERRLTERGAAANERTMRVGLMDGARAGRGGGKMLSSGITSAAGFADLAVSRGVLAPFLHCRAYFLLITPSIDRLVCWSLSVIFLCYSVQKRSSQKGSTNAWRACPEISCSMPSLRSSASANSGRSSSCGRGRSNRRCT